MNSRRSPKNQRLLGRPNVFPVVALLHYLITSLRGRRSKRNGKGSRARDHARGRSARPNSPFPFQRWSRRLSDHRKVTRDDRKYVCVQSLLQMKPLSLWPSFFGNCHLSRLYPKKFLFFWIFKLGTVRIDKVLLWRRKRWILAMNDDPDIKEHKSFANEHLFDVWFLFQIWNSHWFWFWTTNDPPWSAYYSGKGISANNPFNERIFNKIATMIAQKRTRKCTRKCKHFRCLRENNNGFEEPDGHNK